MTVLSLIPYVFRGVKWLVPKVFEAERERRGPSFWKKAALLYAGSRTYAKEYVRVSASYIFRIKVDGRYLLIQGQRIPQYQPIGGVYKYYRDEVHDIFTKLDVRDDELLPIDDHSRDDVRVRLLGKNLIGFLNWFTSEKGRETTQNREFKEELVDPGFLSAAFAHIEPRYLYTVWRPLTFSPHSQAMELMVYQVFDLRLTSVQEAELRSLQLPMSGDLRWVTEAEIKRLGADQLAHAKPFRIGQHTQFLLSSVG
jgi:hypothetical protein